MSGSPLHEPLVSVIGAGAPTPAQYAHAQEVGRLLAQAGYGVVTGGMGGVMEAACRGCAEAGGMSVGVIPGLERGAANAWCRVVVATGIGQARNVLVVASGLGAVAVGGGGGTLSEMGHALKMGRPVVSLGSWAIPGVGQADTPAQAVEALLARLA